MWKEAVMTEPEILFRKFLNGLRKATQIVRVTCVPVEMQNRNFGIRVTNVGPWFKGSRDSANPSGKDITSGTVKGEQRTLP
jgi:hypothetical protein